MVKRVRVSVHGRVQNVGFRQYTAMQANRLGISGWVRNTPDGRTVELEAEGDEGALETFVAAVRRGPSAARVERVEVETLSFTEGSGRFRVTG